jgi:hypothetical protein
MLRFAYPQPKGCNSPRMHSPPAFNNRLPTACPRLPTLAAGALPGNPTTANLQIIVVKSVIVDHFFVVIYVNMVYNVF